MGKYYSKATAKNWSRLDVSEDDSRLISRANKTKSKKNIIPLEYFSDKNNVSDVKKIAGIVRKYDISDAFFSLGLNFLLMKKISLKKNNASHLMSEYNLNIINELYKYPLPENEFDILGLIYQCVCSEGEKNIKGSYYTPPDIINSMLNDCCFNETSSILDPCCGSGAFLMCIKGVSPCNLYGFDIDPIAVMIAKFNLIAKYPHMDFIPKIFCCDFNTANKTKYDYVITNPPWGAFKSSGGESFSEFMKKGLTSLNSGGELVYLLPRSFMYAKKYEKLRKFIVENYNLKKIKLISENFSGVVTKSVILSVLSTSPEKEYIFSSEGISHKSKISNIKKNPSYSFNFIDNENIALLDKIYKKQKFNLDESLWGLGIVTGDNRSKIYSEKLPGAEIIYSGKDISPFKLLESNQYTIYNPLNFQQCAKEEIYRADEKLLYRFISRYPVFACDNSRALTLNSANILIPKIEGMSIKTVMAFLNSELYKYIYTVQFNDIKVLKSNLMKLPFIKIDKYTNNTLTELASKAEMNEYNALTQINNIVYSLFSLSEKEKENIKLFIKNNL